MRSSTSVDILGNARPYAVLRKYPKFAKGRHIRVTLGRAGSNNAPLRLVGTADNLGADTRERTNIGIVAGTLVLDGVIPVV